MVYLLKSYTLYTVSTPATAPTIHDNNIMSATGNTNSFKILMIEPPACLYIDLADGMHTKLKTTGVSHIGVNRCTSLHSLLPKQPNETIVPNIRAPSVALSMTRSEEPDVWSRFCEFFLVIKSCTIKKLTGMAKRVKTIKLPRFMTLYYQETM